MVNRITLTAGGAPGSGKTSLLMLLLDMLGDMGLLAHHETRSHTIDPASHFAECRVMNADSEAIEVMIDMEAVLAARLALDAFGRGELDAAIQAPEPVRNEAVMEFDGMLLAAIGPDASRHVIQQDIGSLLLAVQQSGHPLLPMTITIDEA